ncbi:MAG: TIGR02221 family CRISPR-associated protein [Candidatus Helarchaeota archaeon]
MIDLIISFLGPSKYLEVFYEFNGNRTKNSCLFIQEALLELFASEIYEKSRFLAVITENSMKANWISKKEDKNANYEQGLRDLLENLKKELNIEIDVNHLLIPEGKSEKELWEIFEIITSNIPENSNILIDITYGYRSLPLLSIIILNYIRFLKKVNIKKIVYGALEAKGSIKEVQKLCINKRVIPIFDLTPFVALFDWTIAIERFLETGDARIIKKLSSLELVSSLKKSKGKLGNHLNKLIKMLSTFSNNILTCRGPNIKSNINGIVNIMEKAKNEISLLKPFSPLFIKVEKQFLKFKIDDDILQMTEVSEWCSNKGLIQQSITFLREAMVNFVIKNYIDSEKKEINLKDYQDRNKRERASDLLSENTSPLPVELSKLWSELIQYRNDINHAGWREHFNQANRINQKCKTIIKKFKDFLFSYEG